MKKEYMKPAMKVVMLKQRYHILGVSRGAKSVKESDEKWNWATDGLGDEDDDV